MQHILVEVIGVRLAPLVYYTLDSIKLYDIVTVPLKNKKCLGVVVKTLEIRQYDFELYKAEKSQYYLTSLQKQLLDFMNQYYMTPIAMISSCFSLASQEYATHTIESKMLQHITLNTLSNMQHDVFKSCMKKQISLIFGATGSGKTEIYFHIIYEYIKQGKQVLVLMPEISLTPQIKRRLDTAFPNLADIWHSKRTHTHKKKILESLQNGTVRIIAGARSALFLPYQNLGLIIVDEEHDMSYKSQQNPKYNARDLSVFLGTKGICVILGSATPSVKSYYLAKERGYLLHLNDKFYKSSQDVIYDTSPRVEISDTIITEISNALRCNKQVIVFVPTRANFKILLCRNCGQKIVCPNCSITLSLHKKKGAMMCHYCNFTSPIPLACEVCGSEELSGMRIGTEEIKKNIQEALQKHSLSAHIMIFDRDHITTSKKLENILEEFSKREIDILIGTQMIAKGHDYHNVQLSVVVGMDYMLNMPDYRAYENAFSLLYQVAGRSARKEFGKIVIQTREQQVIQALWGDYQKVLEHEIMSRRGLYPPFCRLVLVRFSHKKEEYAKTIANDFANIIINLQYSDSLSHDIRNFEIVGVCEAPIIKIKNMFYYQILLRSNKDFVLQRVLSMALKSATDLMLQCIDIDIDPIVI